MDLSKQILPAFGWLLISLLGAGSLAVIAFHRGETINALWFVIAFSLGTTLVIKMGRPRYAWCTAIPMFFLFSVTMTAGWQKIFDPNPRLGFLAAIEKFRGQLPTATVGDTEKFKIQIFNNQMDVVVTAIFMILVILVVLANVKLWWELLTGRTPARLHEYPPVALTAEMMARATHGASTFNEYSNQPHLE